MFGGICFVITRRLVSKCHTRYIIFSHRSCRTRGCGKTKLVIASCRQNKRHDRTSTLCDLVLLRGV